MKRILALLMYFLFLSPSFAIPMHGYSVWGKLKYPKNYSHFDYANPQAPKGGSLTTDASGSFDSFNGFIIQGNPVAGIGNIYNSLMASSADEVASAYCLICETIDISDNKKTIKFKLRKEAKFADGSPITASDVVFSFESLIEKGNPAYKSYYGDVESVKETAPDEVIFQVKNPDNRELPLILGEFVIVSKKFFEKVDFAKPFLDIPVGSGAYKIKNFSAGKFIIYELNPDYWGKNLPINKGKNNINELKYEYYRDRTIALEAFKSGQLDWRNENSARHWATGYDIPAVKNGQIQRKNFTNGRVAPLQAVYFNLRRPLFQNLELRRALTYLWDFEWVQKSIMYGAYTRTQSIADNSVLAARDKISKEEVNLLTPFKSQLPSAVFNEIYQAPKTDGSGNNRENLKIARDILSADGWKYNEKTKLLSKNGQDLKFEILLHNDDLAPHIQPFVQAIEKIGGKVNLKVQETTIWIKSVENHDYDMVIVARGNSESPGNELKNYWQSQDINVAGNENFAGIQSPAIDFVVGEIIKSKTYEELTWKFRALDRIIMNNYYFIPMYHPQSDRMAWWDKYGIPEIIPKNGLSLDYIWYDSQKADKLKKSP